MEDDTNTPEKRSRGRPKGSGTGNYKTRTPNGIEVFKKGRKLKPGTYAVAEYTKQHREIAAEMSVQLLPHLYEIAINGTNESARVSAIKEITNRGIGDIERNINVENTVVHASYADILKEIGRQAALEDGPAIDVRFEEVVPNMIAEITKEMNDKEI